MVLVGFPRTLSTWHLIFLIRLSVFNEAMPNQILLLWGQIGRNMSMILSISAENDDAKLTEWIECVKHFVLPFNLFR